MTGLVIGAVLAAVYVWTQTRAAQGDRAAYFTSIHMCQFVVILEVVTYIYYMLAPKPELLVVSLASERLREKWASAYRSMQLRHYSAFALAATAVVAAGTVVCRR